MGLKFQDIYFTQLSDDGMRIYCDTIKTDSNIVSDCIFNTVDHDCLQIWDARNWHISNCTMNIKFNSGIRIVNCQNCVVTTIHSMQKKRTMVMVEYSYKAHLNRYSSNGMYFMI